MNEIVEGVVRLRRDMFSSYAALGIEPQSITFRELLAAINPHQIAAIASVYPPHQSRPWWCHTSKHARSDMHIVLAALYEMYRFCLSLFRLHEAMGAQICSMGYQRSGLAVGFQRMSRPPTESPALESTRLLHRLMKLFIYYFRHVDTQLLPFKVRSLLDISQDEWGLLPVYNETAGSVKAIAYCTHTREGSDKHSNRVVTTTTIPMPGAAPVVSTLFKSHIHCSARTLFDEHEKMMILDAGRIVSESGLLVTVAHGEIDALKYVASSANAAETRTFVLAYSGWAGESNNASWCTGPVFCSFYSDEYMLKLITRGHDEFCSCSDFCTPEPIEVQWRKRQQPGYFHLVPAMRAILREQWPSKSTESIFIATPRGGLESELTELLMLQTLIDDAKEGDVRAQMLVQHIHDETCMDMEDLIMQQRTRVEQMIADQQAQLQLHAEAVRRHDQRKMVQAQQYEKSSTCMPISSAVTTTTTAAAMPIMAMATTPSDTSKHDKNDDSAIVTRMMQERLRGSWTDGYADLASMLEPGRKKYNVIIKAATRFLYSLRPERINKSGGSHVVFHFGTSSPVTLVRPHASGSKDLTRARHYCTRLYASLQQVALQQFSPPASTDSPAQLNNASSAPLLRA